LGPSNCKPEDFFCNDRQRGWGNSIKHMKITKEMVHPSVSCKGIDIMGLEFVYTGNITLWSSFHTNCIGAEKVACGVEKVFGGWKRSKEESHNVYSHEGYVCLSIQITFSHYFLATIDWISFELNANMKKRCIYHLHVTTRPFNSVVWLIN
jgi:hypothetical protein